MGGHDLIETGGCGAGPALLADRCGLFDDARSAAAGGPSGTTRRPVVIAHGVHLDDEEIALLAARDVAVALCPRSNAALDCGEAPLQRLVEHGVRLGLGTDSLASNESLDLFAEAAAAYAVWQRQAGAAFDPRAAARRILRWLTIEGAQALGFEQQLGSITVGKYADLAVVSLPSPGATDPSQSNSVPASAPPLYGVQLWLALPPTVRPPKRRRHNEVTTPGGEHDRATDRQRA